MTDSKAKVECGGNTATDDRLQGYVARRNVDLLYCSVEDHIFQERQLAFSEEIVRRNEQLCSLKKLINKADCLQLVQSDTTSLIR